MTRRALGYSDNGETLRSCASTLGTQGGIVRLVATCLVSALLILASGCARGASDLGGASASAKGVELSVSLAAAQSDPDRLELECAVSVPGTEPVTLSADEGRLARVLIKSGDTDDVVFDSAESDREALASQPDGFEPPTEETLSEGGSQSASYLVDLPPGSYKIVASTYSPQVNVIWSDVDIR